MRPAVGPSQATADQTPGQFLGRLSKSVTAGPGGVNPNCAERVAPVAEGDSWDEEQRLWRPLDRTGVAIPGFTARFRAGVGSPLGLPPLLRLLERCHRRERSTVGSVIKKRRKRMAKKKHRKLLKKTRVQRRRLGK
jgi:Mitochondrial domain of unknown function (DUF1713)